MKSIPFAALLAASAVVLSACGAGDGSDGRQQVRSALEALNNNGPYRLRIEQKAADSNDIQTIEVVPPNDLHIRIEGDTQGEPNEIYKIGTKAWIREGGAFVESTVSADQEQSFTAASFVASDFMQRTSDFTSLPGETIGAVATKAFAFVHTDVDGTKSTYKMWISTDKGLPVKIEATYPDIVETYLIEMDPTIKIVAPQ